MTDTEQIDDFEERREKALEALKKGYEEAVQLIRDTKPKANAPAGYTTADVATSLLGRHRGSLDRLVDKGRIRTVQDKWRVYYRITDLMKQVKIHALQDNIDKLREPEDDEQ